MWPEPDIVNKCAFDLFQDVACAQIVLPGHGQNMQYTALCSFYSNLPENIMPKSAWGNGFQHDDGRFLGWQVYGQVEKMPVFVTIAETTLLMS